MRLLRLPLLILIVTSFFDLKNSYASAGVCSFVFQKSVEVDGTEQFKKYLKELLEMQIVKEADLIQFAQSIKNKKIVNPVPHNSDKFGVYFEKAAYQIHYEAIEQYLLQSNLDFKNLLSWINKEVKDKSVTRAKREKVKSKTAEIHQKMEFNKIQAGEYMMGDEYHKTHAKITHSYELMSTLVTQKQWAFVMGENPSFFQHDEKSVEVKVKNKKIKMHPDNPVENVSWDDVMLFIKKLNEMSQSGDTSLEDIIPSYKKGDNFRLPTEAEWEFVVRGRGQLMDILYWGNDYNAMENYVWFHDNAEGSTHPVAQLKPLVFEENEFFDMIGNVSEMVVDWWNGKQISDGGIDPTGPPGGTHKVTKGGSWINDRIGNYLYSGSRGALKMGEKGIAVGFRLVRDIRGKTDGDSE